MTIVRAIIYYVNGGIDKKYFHSDKVIIDEDNKYFYLGVERIKVKKSRVKMIEMEDYLLLNS